MTEDFFTNYEDIPGPNEAQERPSAKRVGLLGRISAYFNLLNPHYWIFLILLGFITAMIGWGIDEMVSLILSMKNKLCDDVIGSWIGGYAMWIFLCMFFMFISASIGEYISKDAEGSGIPELKSILSGVNIYRYLSFQALIGKIIGLWAGFCASLSIGKEGPFVHIAAAVANKLAKLKPFRDISESHSIKK